MNPAKRSRLARIFTTTVALLISMLWTTGASTSKSKFLVYVGTYTGKESKGVYAYRLDASGHLSPIGLAAETENPSFVAVHPNRRFLYAANETAHYEGKNSGAVSAFAIDRTSGKLTLLNRVPSGGADPCYLSFDKSGKHLLVANYTGGSVSVLPVKEDGRLGEASAFVQHSGSSVNRERQEGPHAHSIDLSSDGRFAMVADLGLDQVLVDRFDTTNGTLTPSDPPFTKVEAGSGPRHFKFSPDGKSAYLLSELNSVLSTYSYDARAGTLRLRQTLSTLPKEFSGHSEAAEVQFHPAGRFVYASNRGYDSIAVFRNDRKQGTLTRVEIVPSGGKTPRYFTVDPSGTRLFVANQNSGNIVVFKIDPYTGRLTPTGQVVEVPSPVWVGFVRLD